MSTDTEFVAPWIFIIDTNTYAGNFEREMCAYCTGMIGECEVGEEMTHLFEKDLELKINKYDEDHPFMDYIDDRIMHEDGCRRPTSIWCNSDNEYYSVAIFFYEEPTEEHIKIMKERAYKFSMDRPDQDYLGNSNSIKILGFRLLKQEVTTTEFTI